MFCVFVLWVETGVPAKNPRKHGENTETPHRNMEGKPHANHWASVLPIEKERKEEREEETGWAELKVKEMEGCKKTEI